jgi:hypothetical protein
MQYTNTDLSFFNVKKPRPLREQGFIFSKKESVLDLGEVDISVYLEDQELTFFLQEL